MNFMSPRSPGGEATSRSAGFTLVELTSALLVSALVAGGAYQVLRWYQVQDSRQREISRLQAGLVPLQQNLEKMVREAGAGIPMQTRMLDSVGVIRQVTALEVRSGLPGLPSGLVVRGNFSGTRTQARQDAAIGDASVFVQDGGETGFQIGDRIVLVSGDLSEYATITGINAGASTIATSPRSRDYPAGTSLIHVTEVSILPRSADTLEAVRNGRASVLTPHLLGFDLAFRNFQGAVDSVPPFAPAEAKSLLYRLRIAVPVGADSVHRSVSGEVSFRNIRS